MMAQTHLARCVEEVLPTFEVVHEPPPPWLAPQRLDHLRPALSSRSNYQRRAALLPLDHLGGDAGLSDRKHNGPRKRGRLPANGVTLIEWHSPTRSQRMRSANGWDRGLGVQRWDSGA